MKHFCISTTYQLCPFLFFTDEKRSRTSYPKSDMTAGAVNLCQGVGSQQVSFSNIFKARDDLALLASTRE